MDSESNSASQDQISLYGLFGDSATTLSGLSDHFSPSVLQQSPPCGSIAFSTAGSITISPGKTGVNVSHPHGLLLSDLADHSPSAGSVTAATICSHVSFDNLRCTNLVGATEKRYCSQHASSHQENLSTTSPLKPAISLFSPIRSSLSQTMSLVSPSAVQAPRLTVPSLPTLPIGSQPLAGKSVRTVRVDVKSLPSAVFNKNGMDVADGTKCFPIKGGDLPTLQRKSMSQIADALGKKITVSARVPTKKVIINRLISTPMKSNSVTTVQKTAATTQARSSISGSSATSKPNFAPAHPSTPSKAKEINPVASAKKNIYVNLIKPVPSTVNSNKSQPSLLTQINASNSPQHATLKESTIQTKPILTSSTAQPVSIASKSNQSVMIDENTLKALLDALNSQNDMTQQQQIAFLCSLGITVVQAPVDIKKHPSKATVVKKSPGSITKSKTAKQRPGSIATNESMLKICVQNENLGSFSAKNLTKKMQTVQSNSHFNIAQNLAVTNTSFMQHTDATMMASVSRPVASNVPTSSQSVKSLKRKKPNNSDAAVATKKQKGTRVSSEKVPGMAAKRSSQNMKPKAKQAKLTTATKKKRSRPTAARKKSSQAKQPSPSPPVLEICPRPSPALLEIKTHIPQIQKYVKSLNDNILIHHDLFEPAPAGFESDFDTCAAGGDNKTSRSKLLKKHMKKRKLKSKGNVKKEDIDDVPGLRFRKRLNAAKNLLHLMTLPQNYKSSSYKHHEVILDELIQKSEKNALCEIDQDLKLETFDDFWLLEDYKLLENSTETLEKAKLAFTLSTKRLKQTYQESLKNLQKSEEELNLLMESYKEDPRHTAEILNSTFQDVSKVGKKESVNKFHQKQCQVSNSAGHLICSSTALPYSLFCKQHIWHCSNQCLYKLDQNMKPVADINPEPLIKKVRKRPKLLPLIKRYKKKKRKKNQLVPGSEVNPAKREPGEIVDPSVSSESILHSTPVHKNSGSDLKAASDATKSRVCSSLNTQFLNEIAKGTIRDEPRSLDTSEEDLTGHEIMMSGVFDKLPVDLHDFDLFTSDKGAEELEKALLLAGASSPPPDHEKNDSNDSLLLDEEKKMKSPPANSSQVKDVRMSPDVCVVLDAPHASNTKETPPSIESFSQSQCVHYTFGSSYSVTAQKPAASDECDSLKEDDQATEDLTPPILSAEDLQDIEGVLESLQKDEIDKNSPSLRSSPAADQYTSMLARQLSQEVETESLKRLSTTTLLPATQKVSGTSSSIPDSLGLIREELKSTSSLASSYSLPVSDSSDMNLFVPVTASPDGKVSNGVSKAPTGSPQKLTTAPPTTGTLNGVEVASSRSNTLTKLNNNDFLDPIGLDVILPSLHDKSQLAATNTVATSTKTLTSTGSSSSSSTSPHNKDSCSNKQGKKNSSPSVRKTTKKSFRKVTQPLAANVVAGLPRTPQRKVQQPSPIVSNQVLPLTLMQASAQGGNIIKVIVPPGTVMNGAGNNTANHQQNMILIPVNALVRSDVVNSPSQNIPVAVSTSPNKNAQVQGHSMKTQLSSLQAGQQFFIVNNATGSTQSHLTLVQKPNNISASSQTLLLNPTMTPTQQPGKSTPSTQAPVQSNQKPTNQKATKQVLCNIKPNMSVYLNQSINKFLAKSKMSSSAATSKLSSSTATSKMSSSAATSKMSSSATSKTATKVTTTVAPTKPGLTTATKASPSSTANTKMQNFDVGKFSTHRYDIHKVHKAQVKKTPKARFDPITRKYVPGHAKISTDAPIISTASTLSPSMLKEKFNESALSIQNKVQQINSVLSSLNANTNNAIKHNTQFNGQISRKNLQQNKIVKSVTVPMTNTTSSTRFPPNSVSPIHRISTSGMSISTSYTVSPDAKTASSPIESRKNSITISVKRKKDEGGDSVSETNVSTAQTATNVKSSVRYSLSLLENKKRSVSEAGSTSPTTSTTSTSTPTSPKAKANVSDAEIPKDKSPITNVSGGTVHWNQTTTAGPEITPAITVPLYITTGTWPHDLAVNGPLPRGNIPIIFPAHKISPNYQLPQRVILGNIGSLGILSSKKDPQPKSQTVTISAYSQQGKPPGLDAKGSTANSGTTSDVAPIISSPVISQAGTNVTAVMGTTMSPKLSPFNKGSFPERFATIDQQGILHVYKSGSASTSPQKVTQSNPAYVLSMRSPPVIQGSQSHTPGLDPLKEVKMNGRVWSNGNEIGLTAGVPVSSVTVNSAVVDHNANLKMSSPCASEAKVVRKKCGRKASHDTILHDPLMYDPTALDTSPGDNSSQNGP